MRYENECKHNDYADLINRISFVGEMSAECKVLQWTVSTKGHRYWETTSNDGIN